METQLQEQQPNPADTTAKADPKPADLSREELVKEINHWVKETASFWEPMFERMRDKIDFAGGDQDRKSTRLNSSHISESRMPSSA